ncbi:MAG: hypothetical protein PVSMB1_17180 [Gemmatimonadaceae bacterium]
METPIIRLSEAAKRAIQDAAVEAGGDLLRITVRDRFECELCVDARTETDVAVDCGAITILLDAASTQRADGLSIDFVKGPEGSGFMVDNPNKPAGVRQSSARELKAMIDSGRPFELVEVRPEEERAIAKIEGSRLLDTDGHRYLPASIATRPSSFSATTASAVSPPPNTSCVKDSGICATFRVASTPGPRSRIRPCAAIERRTARKEMTWTMSLC